MIYLLCGCWSDIKHVFEFTVNLFMKHLISNVVWFGFATFVIPLHSMHKVPVSSEGIRKWLCLRGCIRDWLESP